MWGDLPKRSRLLRAVEIRKYERSGRVKIGAITAKPRTWSAATANGVKALRGEGVLCNLRAKFAPGMSLLTRRAPFLRASSPSFGP